MSGAEVAGLVLAVVPLLISGLEHYGEGIETLQKMKNSSREFLKLKLQLEVQHEIFLNSLEMLLQYDISDQALAYALETGEWSDPAIDECLRRRLGRSYTAYVGAVESLAETMKEFRSALQIGDDGKGPFVVEKRSISNALKRIKFGLKIRAYIEFMNRIVTQNQALEQLTRGVNILEPIRESKRKTPDFEKAREHAQSVFAAIQQSLLKTCSLKHRASLYMRPIELSKRRPHMNLEGLRLVLHHEDIGIGANALPWKAEEAETRLLDIGSAEKETLQPLPVAARLPGASILCKSSSTQTGQVHSSAPAAVLKEDLTTQRLQQLNEIQDLCQSLQQLRTSPCGHDFCLGYLLDVSKKWCHGLYWPERPIIDGTCAQALSLAQLLDQWRSKGLGEPEKRRLALALASGMLRLYETPWMERQWGKNDILIFTNGIIDVTHPFISRDMLAASSLAQGAVGRKTYFTACRPIKEETLFALGILLIEIAMETRFEELGKPEDLAPDGSKHELSDFCTADRLVDEIYLVAGHRYGDVVRRCIRCQFDQQNCELSDSQFRKKVYEGVVLELELELEDIMSR